MTTNWAVLGKKLNTLKDNGSELLVSQNINEALEEILGERWICDTVDTFIEGRKGSQLAIMTVGSLRLRKAAVYGISFPFELGYSENDMNFYINCGIFSDTFEQLMGREIVVFPKGYDHIFLTNFADIAETGKYKFLLDNTTDLGELGTEIKQNLAKLLVFFDTIASLEILIDLWVVLTAMLMPQNTQKSTGNP